MRLRPALGRLLARPALSCRRSKRPRINSRRLDLGTLDDRIVPTTTVYLDLGLNLPAAGLQMTVQQLRDINGGNTGPDLNDSTLANGGYADDQVMTFTRFNFDYDGNGTPDAADTAILANDILRIVQRAYEPFNVEVRLASAASIADVQATLNLNGNGLGNHDAYNFVTAITDANGLSAGAQTGLFGLAAGNDLNGAGINAVDEATITFADNFTTDSFEFRLAYTAAHEAAHTFALAHSDGAPSADERLLTRGDQIRVGSDTRTEFNIFTRFSLVRQSPPGGSYNNFDRFAADPNIGLADSDSDGLANFAYVTGTGGHDRITITRASASQAVVLVEAFRAAGKTPADFIRSETYSIDTRNGILVDASVNDDEIIIDADIGRDVRVRGGIDSDTLRVVGSGLFTPTGSFESVTYRATGPGAGSLDFGSFQIAFSELEPVIFAPTVDTLVVDVVDNAANAVTIEDAGADNDGMSQVTLDGGLESITFTNPTGILEVRTNAGNDTITVNGMDSGFSASLVVRGGIGDDGLTVNLGTGLNLTAGGLTYDGGVGQDSLILQGGSLTSSTYSPAATPGTGNFVLAAGASREVDFVGVETVRDLSTASTLTVRATAGDNAISYGPGSTGSRGLVAIDDLTAIEFANKTELTINALAGNDTVNLNNSSTPTALTMITVNASDGDDTVTTLAGLPTDVTFNGGAGNDVLDAAGVSGDAAVNGGTGNDILIGGGGDDALDGGSGEDILDGRGGSNSLIGGADTDTILVSGTSGPDTISTTHGAGTFDITGGLSAGNNTIASVEAVRVEAGDGADGITLNLLAAGGLHYTVLGGNPIGTTLGDSLTVNSAAAMTVTPGPENDAGSVDAATATPTNVSFDEIELLIIGGGGGGVINGTNGNDAITVIARDDTFNAAANGVQDFTGVVNAGLQILFLDQPTLAINALGGSDTIVLRTPAPNNAVWDVDVTIDGGTPSAGDPSGSDRLVVETPGGAAETAVYTPTSADAGTLDLTSLSSLITLNAMEELLYDGEADNDSLSVVGTGGADIITHIPGATDQAGAFRVNGLLPIAYENMGAGGALIADGGGGSDTLVYLGTNANDTFRVLNAAGDVALNSRLVVATSNIETLTLEGLLGDDLFDIVPSLPSLTYGTVNANGGAQASATGDRTVLSVTGGNDDIGVSGQVVTVGGKTVASSGVENIALDAAGGTDVITYAGVAGTAEAINFISSGVAGQGQISVPGVSLVTFSGVENVQAIGNTGGAGDEDTLAFTGTNGIDVLSINLAAAGTAADPILRLLDAAGMNTLLTLLNYSNFNTLRVNALEGEDVINVFTSAAGPSRNLFVDGGAPSGKKKSTDKLTVFYTPPRPRIIHSAETQDPDAGLVDLDYSSARFLVQYDDVEDVVIRRL